MVLTVSELIVQGYHVMILMLSHVKECWDLSGTTKYIVVVWWLLRKRNLELPHDPDS